MGMSLENSNSSVRVCLKALERAVVERHVFSSKYYWLDEEAMRRFVLLRSCLLIGFAMFFFVGCDSQPTVAKPSNDEAFSQVAGTLREAVVTKSGKPSLEKLNVAMESVDAAASQYGSDKIKVAQTKAKELQQALSSNAQEKIKSASADLLKFLDENAPTKN